MKLYYCAKMYIFNKYDINIYVSYIKHYLLKKKNKNKSKNFKLTFLLTFIKS